MPPPDQRSLRPDRHGLLRRALAACWCLLAAAGLAAAEPQADIDVRAVRAFAEELCAIPDRGQGRPGAAQAAERIADELRAAGLEPRIVLHPVSVQSDRGTRLTVDGRTVAALPLGANHAATAGTGGEAISGPLRFIGRGSFAELAGKQLDGCIAVADPDIGMAWTNAAMLGARALIVRGRDQLDRPRFSPLHLQASIPFPRFTAEGLEPAMEGASATLRSTVAWEDAQGRSVVALVPASGAGAARMAKELVVLTAGYEANGPAATPGAMRAVNAAVLLELARSLARAPAPRPVLIVFNGARADNLLGLRQISSAIVNGRDGDGWRTTTQYDELDRLWRQQAWQADRMAAAIAMDAEGFSFAGAIAGLLASWRDAPPQSRIDSSRLPPERLLGRVLSIAAAERADARLAVLDAKRAAIERELPAGERPAARRALRGEEDEYQSWRTVQQKLDAGKALDAGEDALARSILPRARALLEGQRALCQRRLAETASLLALRGAIGPAVPVQVIGLDLSDGNDRLALHFDIANGMGRYSEWLNSGGMPAWSKAAAAKGIDLPVDAAPWELPSESGSWWPAFYQHEQHVCNHQIPGATLRTTADLRLRNGTPADGAGRLDWSNLGRQCIGLDWLVRAWTAAPQIIQRRPAATSDALRVQTVQADVRAIGTKVGTRGLPFPHAWIDSSPRNEWFGDSAATESRWGDLYGAVRVDNLYSKGDSGAMAKRLVRIYRYDQSGAIDAVVASKGRQQAGNDNRDMRFRTSNREELADLLALLVEARPSALYQIFDPRSLAVVQDDEMRRGSNVRVLAATRDSEPNLAQTEQQHGHIAIFVEPGVRMRVLASHGKVGNFMALTGQRSSGARGEHAASTDWASEGLGHGVLSAQTAVDAGADMFRLNDQRLELLRRNGIDSDSLVSMHAKADAAVAAASEARAAGAWDRAQAAGQAAWSYAQRVYPAALGTANDVVYGLVVLLFFAIPFAILCERLFISGSTIGRKVAGFTGFFIATFLFFYAFHPAFALATTPMVVFLAFLILLMSLWVIGVVVGRFELEMQRLRSATLGQHSADVSRLGALVATMGLGISNMRRRRLRTFLTTSTVVLMTFILLTFASFTPTIVSQHDDLGEAPPYQGLLLRLNGWAPMPEDAESRIALAAGDRFAAAPLRWLSPRTDRPRFPVSSDRSARSVGLPGVVGVGRDEPSGILGALVRGPLDDPSSPRGLPAGAEADEWIFLPEEVLAQLQTAPGGSVRFLGSSLRAGVIDARAFAAVRQIGGDAPTPISLEGARDRDTAPDPDSMAQRLAALDGGGNASSEGLLIHLGPSSVAIASAATVARHGGRLAAISLVPLRPDIDLAGEADRLAEQLALNVRLGHAGRSEAVVSVSRLSVAGLGSVLVPLILGGLIIFSTMLNSVAERGREIFIYASLGLAPVHILALFLVEASIYAVLGGLGGYMLAQLLTWGLGVAAAHGWGVQPDLNYSSFTAVATILLVMATVLASALYPAMVAARAANPGTKDFVLPDPTGDTIGLEFPFTVAARDAAGLMSFLRDWFEAHTDASTGCFTAADARFESADGRHAVEARTWLAPFDLGISQRFRLECRPTDMRAIYAVHVRIDLLSGQRSNWRTANIAFMKELRRQFLVWRTLTPAVQARYRERTAAPAPLPVTA